MTARQHIHRLLLFCLFLIILVACGSTPPTIVTPTPVGESAGERRPITLFLWYSWPEPEQSALVTLVDRYNRSHPLTQIIPQARPVASLNRELRSALRTGSGPHLVIAQSHTLGSLAQDNLLLALDDSISPAERDLLLPAAIGSAQVKKTDGATALYGMPLTFDTLVLYYNKSNVLTPPADTDTLLTNARGLTQPPIWGLAYNLSLEQTIGYLYAFGGRIFDEQGNLVLGSAGRAGAERWLAWLAELRKDQRILSTTDSIVIKNALDNREVLMTIDWAHAMPSYRALWSNNLGVAVLPRLSGENRPPQPYVQSDVISLSARITADAERLAALDFVRYLLNEESQQTLLNSGKQPVLLGLKLDNGTPEHEAAQVFRTQAQQGQPMPNSRMTNEVVWEVLQLMQLNVLRNVTTPADAVTSADAMLRERLGLPPAP